MASPSSFSKRLRSNWALACATSTGARLRPGRLSSQPGVFCQPNMTWNNGACARLRTGCTISTICSNGMSWWAWALRVWILTRSIRAATVGESDRSIRRARVLTKKPIRPSISDRPRLAEGVPITTSAWPESRESVRAQPASRVMNRVTPCRWLKALSCALRSASSRTACRAPA